MAAPRFCCTNRKAVTKTFTAALNTSILKSQGVIWPAYMIISRGYPAGVPWYRTTKHKMRGPKVNSGEWVWPGQVIVTQYQLRYHPGKNVTIQKEALLYKENYNLVAQEAGRVMVSTEKCEPDLQNPIAKHFYATRTDQTFYKKYYHVIPPPMEKKFRLVDLV